MNWFLAELWKDLHPSEGLEPLDPGDADGPPALADEVPAPGADDPGEAAAAPAADFPGEAPAALGADSPAAAPAASSGPGKALAPEVQDAVDDTLRTLRQVPGIRYVPWEKGNSRCKCVGHSVKTPEFFTVRRLRKLTHMPLVIQALAEATEAATRHYAEGEPAALPLADQDE